jgi:hypothetical protein
MEAIARIVLVGVQEGTASVGFGGTLAIVMRLHLHEMRFCWY